MYQFNLIFTHDYYERAIRERHIGMWLNKKWSIRCVFQPYRKNYVWGKGLLGGDLSDRGTLERGLYKRDLLEPGGILEEGAY